MIAEGRTFPLTIFSHRFLIIHRLVVLLIISCLLLRGFSPKIILELKENQTISKAVASQSALFKLFTLQNLALKMANCLLSKKSPAQQKTSGQNQTHNAAASSEFSISHYEKRSSIIKYGVQHLLDAYTGTQQWRGSCFSPFLVNTRGVHPVFEFYLLLLLLIIVSMFVRSYLGGMLTVNSDNIITTQLRRMSWVFSLSGEREEKVWIIRK
jgi:hypothetical protein